MSALPTAASLVAASVEDAAIDALPQDVVGIGEWHALAVRNLVAHFVAAAESGQGYRVANAVRAMAHVPSRDELAAVTHAVCNVIARESLADRSDWRRTGERLDTIRRIAFETLDDVGIVAPAKPGASADVTVKALLGLVELRQPVLAEHLRSVGTLARRIGTRMALDAETVGRVARAAILHDVGLAASDTLDGELGSEHVLAGARYLTSVPELADVAEIVRGHHERYDGSGFPDALAAESIPIEARIIAVADTFHTTAVALEDQVAGLSAALKEVRSSSGTRFDPVVVSALSQLMGRNRTRTSRSA